MVFPTVVLSICLLPHIRSVKVVIDGTIDFGPNWNFKYKLKPISDTQPRKRIADKILTNNEDVKTNATDEGISLNNTTSETIDDVLKNVKRDRADSIIQDYSSEDKISKEKFFEVTKLYKTELRNGAMLRYPHKIKDDIKVTKFVERIKGESLKMFDNLRKAITDKAIVQKVAELKRRYSIKFGEFINETKHHTIRTAYGNKRVVLNTIDYSNKLLNRLVNRFIIDLEDSGLRSDSDTSKTLKEHIGSLKIGAYEDACRIFSVCKAGNEFTDHISDLITKLLQGDDVKVQTAVKAITKSLKNTDFSKIMDAETQRAFRDGLALVEELNPFELRVLLMAYKIIIENRHQPFQSKDPNGPMVKVILAMYHVIEEVNKNIIIATKDWNSIKKSFDNWLARGEGDVSDIANELVDRVKNKIDSLDNKTANDFKAKLRICFLANTSRSFMLFQPFIM